MKKLMVIIMLTALVIGCAACGIDRENEYELAVLVNNQDFSHERILEVARTYGYRGNYNQLCEKLVKDGFLVHLPDFTYDGVDFSESYVFYDTIIAGIYREYLETK